MPTHYRSLVQSAAPSAVVTAAEAKLHGHVTHDAEDDEIDEFIATATNDVEEYTGRQLINATWVMKLDEFPRGRAEIVIPKAPLSSITSVAYLDSAGSSQTLVENTDYVVDTSATPATLYLTPTVYWPTTYGEPNDVTITFVAGYGATAASVPDRFKVAIKMVIADYFANREEHGKAPGLAALPLVQRILANDKVEWQF